MNGTPRQSELQPRTVLIFAAILIWPLLAFLVGPTIIQHKFMKAANAKARQLGYYAAAVNVQEIPCHGWTDFGYSIDYQIVPGEKPHTGRLCRQFGDDDWTWHPE